MSDERIITIVMIVGFVLVLALIVTAIVVGVTNENNMSKITSGTVIDKYYHPPRLSQTKYSATYSPARYSVTVRGDNGITAVYEVTPEKYNEVKINDWYPNVNEELK
jgi:hypothetical protein